MLKPGDDAPDFTLQTEEGKPLSLKDSRGKKVLLWFYPQANTPACTAEACSLRDNFDYYLESDIVVLGVSFDPVEDNRAFAKKFQLPFHLLSDIERKVALAYGACTDPKAAYADRISYLIDEQGRIARTYPQVDPRIHAAEVLADLLGEGE